MPGCKDRAESSKVFRVDVRIGPSERTFIVFSFFINPWLCVFFMLSLYDKVFSVPGMAAREAKKLRV